MGYSDGGCHVIKNHTFINALNSIDLMFKERSFDVSESMCSNFSSLKNILSIPDVWKNVIYVTAIVLVIALFMGLCCFCSKKEDEPYIEQVQAENIRQPNI